jgi:cell shape-determining protein MreC
MSRSAADFRRVFALCVAGVALGLVPPEITARWRAAVRDILRPGQTAVRLALSAAADLTRELSPRETGTTATRNLETQLAAAARRNRQLEVQLAALADQQKKETQSPELMVPRGETRPPLLVPQLVEARVLGESTAALWRSRKLVGAGASAGIVESALVLDDSRTLVDEGQDTRLSVGDAVYAGRCVVGKIAEVGRYSSTVETVTGAGYSGRARVARRTTRGLVFGSTGTLVGDGSPRCRLRHISEPVNVGDEVYTGGTDGILPFAMYYGRIVRAELEPAATEWTIEVEPATDLDRFERVQILRLGINAGRILAD